MKYAVRALQVFAIVVFLIWGIGRIFLVMQDARNSAYISGYEQCTHDTWLYLQVRPDCAGISYGMRHYLQREKPSPQTTDDMARLILAYEKEENGGWHEYWLGNGPMQKGAWQ